MARRSAPPASLFDAAAKEPVSRVDAPDAAEVIAGEIDVARSGEPVREGRVAASGDVDLQGRPAGDGETDGQDRPACSGETLDRIVVGGWERLTSRAAAPCLLCGGTMEPAYGAHAGPIGGRCGDCGTTLT
jgi:hypothetical protein